MNKEVKQLLIKLAIIVGVIILSAFVTVAGAAELKYFKPKNGDVSLTSPDFVNWSVDDWYYYGDFASNRAMCDAIDTSLSGRGRYEGGANDQGWAEGSDTLNAARSLGDYEGNHNVMVILNGLGLQTYDSNVSECEWGWPTPPRWIGSKTIKADIVNPTGVSVVNTLLIKLKRTKSDQGRS